MDIDSRQGIIQQIQISVSIHSPSEAHSLLLATTYIHPLEKEEEKSYLCDDNILEWFFF